MKTSEQKMFNGLTFALGLLAGGIAAAGVGVAARFIGSGEPSVHAAADGHAVESHADDADMADASHSLLEPVGRVALIGDAELEAAAAAVVAAPAQVDTVLSGPQVFNEACYLCHAPPGVPGAPVVGDADAWGARVAQGTDTLYMHAIDGYQGEAGFMPAKGGRVDLSDDEVRAAVDYMLEQLP